MKEADARVAFPVKKGRRNYERNGHLWVIAVLLTLVVNLLPVIRRFFRTVFDFLIKISGGEPDRVFAQMKYDKMDLTGTSVVALFSILSAFIVFYCSTLRYTNYGISNRKVIAYTVGTWFLPYMLLADGISVVMMFFGYLNNICDLFYVSAVWSCLTLVILIVLSLLPAFRLVCSKVIFNVVKKQYIDMCNNLLIDNPTIDRLKFKSHEERDISNCVYHCSMVIGSDESLTDRMRLINDLLRIPYGISGKRRIKSITDFYEKHHGKESYMCMHFFLHNNMVCIARYLTDHPEDAKYIFTCFIEYIQAINKNFSHGYKNFMKILICFGALFTAMIPEIDRKYGKGSGADEMVGNFYDFLDHVLNTVIKANKLRALILLEFIHALLVMWKLGEIDFESTQFVEKTKNFVDGVDRTVARFTRWDRKLMFNIEFAWISNSTAEVNVNELLYQTLPNSFGEDMEPAIRYIVPTWIKERYKFRQKNIM